MKNIKPKVLEALLNDAVLLSLLGGNRIFQLTAPKADEFPRIVFWEFDNVPEDYADDVEQNASVYMQIDIYCQNESTSALAKQVDKILKSIDFYRIASSDMYDDINDQRVYIKHMRYTTFIESEDE
ncbi:MAG: DUF3168 domain-containing protein [Clostridia bacterium]|jgi:hypothetical protein